jgi:pyruvate dehydrogenase E1 component alpha subunit
MKIPENINALPVAIPIASQVPHAVGIALAHKLQKKNSAVAVYFGDGATSKGDFHEAMNFAGVFKVPCVFICQNNQWAISLPRPKQTASKTLAQKASAYGFEGVLVDGNDALAVYKAVRDALNRAREERGPTLIECYTYRLGNHTTADDWKRYREAQEVENWEKKDPLERMKKYLRKQGVLNEKAEKEIWTEARTKIDEAVKKFEAREPIRPEKMFENIFEVPPSDLRTG